MFIVSKALLILSATVIVRALISDHLVEPRMAGFHKKLHRAFYISLHIFYRSFNIFLSLLFPPVSIFSDGFKERGEVVLVFSRLALSRAAAVVLAYLIKSKYMTLQVRKKIRLCLGFDCAMYNLPPLW